METFKNYEVVGITDREQCECCGKTGLKRTVAMRLIGTEIVSHFGVICAAAAAKYSTLEMAADAKKEVDKAVRAYERKEKEAKKQAAIEVEKAAKAAAAREAKLNARKARYYANMKGIVAPENMDAVYAEMVALRATLASKKPSELKKYGIENENDLDTRAIEFVLDKDLAKKNGF